MIITSNSLYDPFQVSSLQVVNSFIDRIEEINPILNCVVAKRYDEARKDAQKADDLIKSGAIPEEVLEKEKPFLGVPFTTKDCIAVKGTIDNLKGRFVSVISC